MRISSQDQVSDVSSLFMQIGQIGVKSQDSEDSDSQSFIDSILESESFTPDYASVEEEAEADFNQSQEDLEEIKLNSANFTAHMLDLVKSGESFADALLKTSEAQFKQLFEQEMESNGGNVKEAVISAKTQLSSEVSDEELLGFIQGLAQDYKMSSPEISEQLSELAQELSEEMAKELEEKLAEQNNEQNNTSSNDETSSDETSLAFPEDALSTMKKLQYPKNDQDFMELFQNNQHMLKNTSSMTQSSNQLNAVM